MRNRVHRLLEGLELGSAPLISTFHSLCVRILRRDIEALKAGYTRSFTIYDQDDAVRLTRNFICDLGLDDKQLAPRSVQAAISAAKNRGEDAESFAARRHGNSVEVAAQTDEFALKKKEKGVCERFSAVAQLLGHKDRCMASRSSTLVIRFWLMRLGS